MSRSQNIPPHVIEEQPHMSGFTGPTSNELLLILSDAESGLDIDDTDGDDGCRGWWNNLIFTGSPYYLSKHFFSLCGLALVAPDKSFSRVQSISRDLD